MWVEIYAAVNVKPITTNSNKTNEYECGNPKSRKLRDHFEGTAGSVDVLAFDSFGMLIAIVLSLFGHGRSDMHCGSVVVWFGLAFDVLRIINVCE